MTRFEPPPDAPPEAGGVSSHAPSQPPWSTAAISGFVISLLGCLLVTAPLGLILGIIGIVRTSGGQRRGRGLAVAAVPISLLTGLISSFLAFGVVVAAGAITLVRRLPDVFAADASGVAAAVSVLREAGSETFNGDIGTEQLQEWLERIAAKHGKLVEVVDFSRVMTSSSGEPMINVQAKFVNGSANVQLAFQRKGWRLALEDINVDGSSPRDAK